MTFMAIWKSLRVMSHSNKKVTGGENTVIFAILVTAIGLFFARIDAADGGAPRELPIIRIDTENEAPILDLENYIPMRFTMTDPNNPMNNVFLSSGGIRGRGNSTWSHPKKPYRVKFDEKKSLFGLPAAKSWALLAEYFDPTFLTTSTAFHLGDIFDMRFNHHIYHVQLYINGQYEGIYLLTEQNQVGNGRVDIDETKGWLVNMDIYYNEDPKFKTTNYNLPVIIKFPEIEPADIGNPAFNFVMKDINELTDSMASRYFPENGYRNLIDMNTFVNYLMVNEIVLNNELYHPKSVYSYKDNGGKISMGPLWDFDWAFNGGSHVYFQSNEGRSLKHAFFNRFFEDPVFVVKYKERWNEKYNEILNMTTFIDDLSKTIEGPFADDYNRWKFDGYESNYPEDYVEEVNKMKTWWNNRVSWLHAELNNAEVLPNNKIFPNKALEYSEIAPQTFTLVTYGNATKLSAKLQKANLSDFEISTELRKKATGYGGYLSSISVRPKSSLPIAAYDDTLVFKGENRGYAFTINVPLSFTVTETDAILTPDRVIRYPDKETTATVPVNAITADFTVGPNPAKRSSLGATAFFRQGPRVSSASLFIYDAYGNAVKKITIRDDAATSPKSTRRIGYWDLTDQNGRPVPYGAYLLKGVITTANGKSERVSLILGVR